MKRISIILLLTSLICSCTIKEDRFPCPCYLEFEPEENAALTETFRFLAYEYGSDVQEQSGDISWKSVADGTHMTSVKRGIKTLVALQGVDRCTLEGLRLMVPYGSDCDRFSCASALVDCTDEIAVMPIAQTKHYCTVRLTLDYMKDANPYGIRVVSDIAGLDLQTLEPVKGEFSYTPQVKDNRAEFRLPRQKDNSFYIELLDSKSGKVLSDLGIGSLFSKAGYDWSKPVLADMDITITFAPTSVTISVEDFEVVSYIEKI